MEKRRGHYLGTEIDGKWWKRYGKNQFLARGLGDYWQNEEGFYFLRYATQEPIFIPFRQALTIKTGKWHFGRWAMGRDIIKIVWQSEGHELSSGFIVAGGKKETLLLKNDLERLVKGAEK
ncbi:MAG: PH-like domain-containing protein [Candidatus Aminicenantales bacterium]